MYNVLVCVYIYIERERAGKRESREREREREIYYTCLGCMYNNIITLPLGLL